MRTVLVTGGAKRLGRLVALAAARDGWDVVLHHHDSVEDAEATCREVRALGRRCATVRADLAVEAEVRALVGDAAAAIGSPVTGLVNSASRFQWDEAASLGLDAFAGHAAVNAFAPARLAADLAAGLPGEAEGSVVNLLDFKLANPDPDYFSYSVSKYALQGATRLLARALAPRVRVNAVAPGYMLPAPGQDEAEFRRLAARTPLGRPADAEDVAAAVVFLLGNRSATGQEIALDCGLHFLSRDRDVGLA